MKQKIKALMSKLSLFWRYFFLLSAVVLVFLAAFTAATRQFTKVLQNSYLGQARSSFEANAQLFARDVFLTHSLPMAMEDAEHYVAVATAVVPLDTQYVFSLSELGDTFAYQCTLLGLPNEGFMYFRRNGICLTRGRIFTDMESCLNSYLIYNDDAQELLLQRLQGKELYHCSHDCLHRKYVQCLRGNIHLSAASKERKFPDCRLRQYPLR